MGFKVNMYSASTGGASFRSFIETILFDFCVGLVGFVFSVFGYKANMILVAVPFGLIGLMCFSSAAYNTFLFIKDVREEKAKKLSSS